MLTAKELQVSPEDFAYAQQLIAEGWIQTSSKFRHIRRWAPPGPPDPAQLIAPEFRDTAWGRRAIKAIKERVFGGLHGEYPHYDVTLYPAGGCPMKAPFGEVGCYDFAEGVVPNPLIEERTLTVTQFKAFKKLGGSF